MLIVETIAKIRRHHFVDGLGIKTISRKLGLSRNTVRSVIRSGVTEHKYSREQQPFPQLGNYVCRLETLLDEDWQRPKKRRFTAMRLFELLQSEGYGGGYDSVQRYIKKWRTNHGKTKMSAFIPLQFEPGDAYQFDWSHESVVLGGVAQVVKVAHFRLSHSRQPFVVAYPRESLEMVIDAHNRAFTFYGGTCRRGIYDNMSTAVDKVLHGKERKFNRRFFQLCSHYLVEPVACTPGAGWEKGQVERQVKNIREWLFTPRPRFKDFVELNSWLAEQCLVIGQKRKHPEDKERTIGEVFQAEQPSLIAVAAPFTGYVEHECSVSPTSLICYDRNHYSVVSKMVGKTVTVRASADHIQIVSNGEIVGGHIRQFGRDKTIYDPWHYLGILDHKPGGLRDGAPFKDWPLPIPLRQMQQKLLTKIGGDREFISILQATQRYGIEVAEQACRQALTNGTVRSEVVVNIMARAVDPPTIDPIATPERFQLILEPLADCARYDKLCQGVSHETH
ncbi:MAG: IS21 family transposase [Spirochaetales bacterium]|jgi:transposase|nr:IS21 family transposase [Spirochaetales bacterium]